MTPRRVARLALVAATVLGASAAGGGASSAIGGPRAAATVTCTPCAGAGGEFHALTPTRILDTRPASKIGPVTGPVAFGVGGATINVPVLGRGGVPASATDVLAVVATVTVAQPTGRGSLTIFPSDLSVPATSNLNFISGQASPNLAVFRTGPDGAAKVLLKGPAAANAQVLIDVSGWISSSSFATRGARLVTVGPARLYDSRIPQQPLGNGGVRTQQIRGVDSIAPVVTDIVPNSADVVGVVLDVVAVRPAQPTFVTVQPNAVTSQPTTSNMNVGAGKVRANLVIVPVGADGNVRVYNYRGPTDIVIDVVGYLVNNRPEATRSGRILPLSLPLRTVDTRIPAPEVKLGPGQAEGWDYSFTIASLTIDGQSPGAVGALVANFTGTDLERQYPTVPVTTFLTEYPADVALPGTSNVNFGEGENVANLSVMKLDAGDTMKVYNASGYTHYIHDVQAVVLE